MSRHSIKAVASRTELSPHLIRMWERRYGAVKPTRTPTNRRLYSDHDIERLILLRRATEAGESIGTIASLSDMELTCLVPRAEVRPLAAVPVTLEGTATAEYHLQTCLRAAQDMNGDALESGLFRASVSLGHPQVLESVVHPLLERVGDMWANGSLSVRHEHLVSATVRTFLGHLIGTAHSERSAPTIVVTTPHDQLHELGALMVAAAAAMRGWHPFYLGPNAPAEDIAGAVADSGARAVALSIVFPTDDPHLATELAKLRNQLGPLLPLLVGGRGASAYADALHSVGATQVHGLEGLAAELDSLRLAG